MTSKTEALKLALEALERYQVKRQDFERFADVITAIKEALAQPKQEPVEDVVAYHSDGTRTVRIAPKRPWVGLTKANMQVLIEQARVVPKQAPCPDYNERLLMLTNAVLQELNT